MVLVLSREEGGGGGFHIFMTSWLHGNKYLAADERVEALSHLRLRIWKHNTNHTGQKTSAALASTGSTQVIALRWQTFEPLRKPVEATALLDDCSMGLSWFVSEVYSDTYTKKTGVFLYSFQPPLELVTDSVNYHYYYEL